MKWNETARCREGGRAKWKWKIIYFIKWYCQEKFEKKIRLNIISCHSMLQSINNLCLCFLSIIPATRQLEIRLAASFLRVMDGHAADIILLPLGSSVAWLDNITTEEVHIQRENHNLQTSSQWNDKWSVSPQSSWWLNAKLRSPLFHTPCD